MSHGMMRFAVSALFVVAGVAARGALAGELIVQPGAPVWRVTPFLECLSMPASGSAEDLPAPPEQGNFVPLGQASIRLGLTDRDRAYWFRLTVSNPADHDEDFVLEVDNPRLNTVACYIPKAGGGFEVSHAGTDHAFGEYTIPWNRPAFYVTVPSHGQMTVYLSVRNKGWLLAEAYLWRPDAFEGHIGQWTLLYGLFYGILFSAALFSAVTAFRLRDQSFLYHSLLALSCLGYEMAFHGSAHQFLWPNAVWWTDRSVFVFLGFSMFFASVFARSFLNLRELAPHLDKFLAAFAVLSLIIPAGKMSDYLWVNAFTHTMSLFGPPMLVLAGVVCLRKGYEPARAYLLGWGVMLVGAILLNLWGLGLLPDNFIVKYSFHFGMAIFPLLQSIALSDRVRYLEKRDQEELERQVAERTRELQEALDNVKTLRGFIPICARCKKVRDDTGYWNSIETYLHKHSDADFTHGICPECLHVLYGNEPGIGGSSVAKGSGAAVAPSE